MRNTSKSNLKLFKKMSLFPSK